MNKKPVKQNVVGGPQLGWRQQGCLLGVCLLLVGCVQQSVVAQVIQLNGKGPAHLSPPESDPTYQLTGEFSGAIRIAGEATGDANRKRLRIGLQVRAIGQGRLEAIVHEGGLPGTKGYVRDGFLHVLTGNRFEDFLVLSGGPWAVFVESESCRVVDREGRVLGKLKRVQRTSPTLHAPAPDGAVILFDGTHTDNLTNATISDVGLLQEGASSKLLFQDFNLHVEFRIPYMPEADEQARGNSGLYLHSRYECQVLDSFGTDVKINGLGALYRQKAPDLNMAFPPLTWQTYDVQFTAPRWDVDGNKVTSGRLSAWINGVKVQDDVELANKTGAGKAESATLLPILFQNHGDPVRFRNIWIVDRGLVGGQGGGQFPVVPNDKQRQEAIARYEQLERARLEANQATEQVAEKDGGVGVGAGSAESNIPAPDQPAEDAGEAAGDAEKADERKSPANGSAADAGAQKK